MFDTSTTRPINHFLTTKKFDEFKIYLYCNDLLDIVSVCDSANRTKIFQFALIVKGIVS
jgi:hypothetical protein